MMEEGERRFAGLKVRKRKAGWLDTIGGKNTRLKLSISKNHIKTNQVDTRSKFF